MVVQVIAGQISEGSRLELDPGHAESLKQRINLYYRRLKDFDAAEIIWDFFESHHK